MAIHRVILLSLVAGVGAFCAEARAKWKNVSVGAGPATVTDLFIPFPPEGE